MITRLQNTTAKFRAFTLIELLTVIAIIGILAAIIIPTVGKVKESAKTSQCISNLRQVALALQLCANDNRGYLPPANAASTDTYWFTAGISGSTLNWSLNPRFTSMLPAKKDATGSRNSVITCPSNNYDEVSGNSVTVSHTYAMGSGAMGLNSFNNDSNQSISRALSSISNPSQAILLLESKLNDATFKIPDSGIQRDDMLTSFSTPTTNAKVQFWHAGANRTNVAFVDGSVRGYSASALNQLYPASAASASFRKAAGL